MIRVAIAGGNVAGSALISLLTTEPNIKVVALYEEKADSPGALMAMKRGIPVCSSIEETAMYKPDMVFNVTDDREISRRFSERLGEHVEIVNPSVAKLLWSFIEKQKKARVESLKTVQNINAINELLQHAEFSDRREFFDRALKAALSIAEAPAGSLVAYKNHSLNLISHSGLSRRFIETTSWNIISGGLTERLIKEKRVVEINDTLTHELNNPALLIENIRAILAVPLLYRDDVKGILFIDDFKPRRFSTRQRSSILLLSKILALVLEGINLSLSTGISRQLIDSIFRFSTDLLIITDREGIITDCSRNISIYKLDCNSIAGKPLSTLFTAQSYEGIRKKLEEREVIESVSVKMNPELFEAKEFNLSGTFIDDKQGVFILSDLTEVNTLRQELKDRTAELNTLNEMLEKKVFERTEALERLNRELQRANEIKERFIANMSHELRTPLNSILGFSDVLLEGTFGTLSPNQERYIRNIKAAGRHLLEMINNVLDLAKIDSGRMELQFETFSVEDVVKEVVTTMKPLADKKSINLILSLDPEARLLTADRIKFKQILYNLLSNAIKFTPEGGTVEVTSELERAKESPVISFSVRDTGVGIPPDALEKIFNEFEQVDSSLSRQYGGVGLGLALTKKLVELHGGDIRAESQLGRGSTFTFTIPYILKEEVAEETEVIEAVKLDFPWADEEAPLILVVEDDPATSEIVTLHLTQAGYRVAHAFNGEEAIQKARSLKPFAITLDIMLPQKDGWEVLQELKTDETTADIPVIIHSIVNNKELAFALGATDYLMKPLDKETLLQTIESLKYSRERTGLPLAVLLIESNEEELEELRGMLEELGAVIYTAKDVKKGFDLAVALKPNLILLNLEDPAIEDFDIVKELKDSPSTRDIPIFLLTSKDLSVEERMGLIGKIERILKKKTFDASELIEHIKELEIIYPKRAGLVDALTGLFSHRYFNIRLAQEVERARRYKLPLVLVLLDIDHFEHYINKAGKSKGNSVLKKVSELIRKNIRGSDVIVRYGGDSFAILLPNTPLNAGLSLSNRFNAIIKNYPFPEEHVQPKGCITASIGIAFYQGESTEELILFAKRALSLAKNKGGDRVEVFTEKMEASKSDLH